MNNNFFGYEKGQYVVLIHPFDFPNHIIKPGIIGKVEFVSKQIHHFQKARRSFRFRTSFTNEDRMIVNFPIGDKEGPFNYTKVEFRNSDDLKRIRLATKHEKFLYEVCGIMNVKEMEEKNE